MIDPLATWKSTFAALPKVSDASWAPAFAAWYNNRIVNIQPVQTSLNTSAGFLFTFSESTFATQLAALTPTTSQSAGIAGFANAWATAIALTIFPAMLNVSPGAYIPPPTPATTFSSITSVILDPTSITAAIAKINELATAPVTSDPNTSEFPEKFRDATLLLTITVMGLNSAVPTPSPITASMVPLN